MDEAWRRREFKAFTLSRAESDGLLVSALERREFCTVVTEATAVDRMWLHV
jgi:hypothetical protein